jgi:hypothetical protein
MLVERSACVLGVYSRAVIGVIIIIRAFTHGGHS